jgi:hypothetical protein
MSPALSAQTARHKKAVVRLLSYVTVQIYQDFGRSFNLKSGGNYLWASSASGVYPFRFR